MLWWITFSNLVPFLFTYFFLFLSLSLTIYFLKFLFKSNTIHFSSLAPFHSLQSLFYLWCKFYFLSLLTLPWFPTLIIAPPSILSKSFFLPLVIPYLSLLSYNSLINTGSFALIVWLRVGVNFAGVGLFLGLGGFVLAPPEQQHSRHGGQNDFQSASWREWPTKEWPTKEWPNNNWNSVTTREPT